MKSRTFKSMRNTSLAVVSQIINSALCFITRTIFIYALGNEYLGFNGLFSDILTILSLAELGVGTAVLYSMYKPAAEKDRKKMSALLNFYRHIYMIIGIFITASGLCLIPFLNFFISDINYSKEVPIIYILYLFNTSCSYFFIYKKSILIVEQNYYIISIIEIIATLFQNTFQIIVLLIFKNFLIYLGVQIAGTLINNICISIYIDKKYKYLKENKKEKLDKKTIGVIFKNIMAMFFSKISSAVVTSTDNILISKFVSTILLGLYSNYTMFVSVIRLIFGKTFEAISGSVGNLIVTESKEKSFENYHKIWFLNFWLIGFCSISLFILINSFIELWIGQGYVLNITIVFFICLNLYMRLIRNTSLTFIESYGLFTSIKWKCIAEAVINLIASLFYLKILNLGIIGVLLGTFSSNILTNFWYEPYVIYKKEFKRSLNDYFIKFIKYITAVFITGITIYKICDFITINNLYSKFVVNLIICCFLINIMFCVFFYKTKEFKYFSNCIIKILNNLKKS